MESKDHTRIDSGNRHLTLLREYKDTVERLFPALGERALDSLSVSPADALFMGSFLDHYPYTVTVLDRGASIGTSTFLLASHQKVSRVVGVDSNLPLAENAPASPDSWDGSGSLESPESPGALDVARAALAEYTVERHKTELYDSAENPEEASSVAASVGERLLVLIHNLQTREEVAEELKATFERHPHAIVLLGHCRRSQGPFVQAGVVDFMEESQDSYHFQLVSDLCLGLASSNFGAIYPDRAATETSEVLDEVSRTFSEKLDPLRLLQQGEELTESVNRMEQQLRQARKSNKELREQNSRLEEQNNELNERVSALTQRNEHLSNHYSSRRYKLADAAMERVSRVKSLEHFIRAYQGRH